MLRATLLAIAALAGSLQVSAQEPASDTASSVADDAFVAPQAGGPRRWEVVGRHELDMHKAPTNDSPVIRTLTEGAILSNLGCARGDDRIWCEVRPLRSRSRGYVAADDLRPARGPDGSVPMGSDDSLQRARAGDFDASATIPCAQIRGQPMGECAFGVARGGGGDATVVVTFSNGFKRMLFFTHGEFMSGDATMSGTGRDTDWHRDGDRHIIRVDDQRYVLQDTAIFGD